MPRFSSAKSRSALQQAEDALRRQMAADLDPQAPRTADRPHGRGRARRFRLPFEKETVVEQALRLRPDLRAARQNIDVADLQIQSDNQCVCDPIFA